ncbi:hypothetical protein [Actinacidiphila oryziradicis]|jgi:hypothetical protein|uniref:hypothetical protein n=1 Tax=Actinacidiphila oryziradicis TaxID=2571141 RepID=UPI0023F54339|nr:hypothetical protein [Actinacidiphila oryziradicis]MCW2875334.1 hypothetical protein [Actinacidiphila oryziradicis]
MRHIRIAAPSAAAAVLLLAGCGISPAPSAPAAGSSAAPQSSTTASTPLDASAALKAIAATVATARLTGVVTAENDSNHLLGRPNQYTSKVTFADSRIAKSDAAVFSKGDVELGGAVEVFSDPANATARAKYIQAVTKNLPALAEYDYVQGGTVVRVSRFLTPDQAGQYKTAAAKLP